MSSHPSWEGEEALKKTNHKSGINQNLTYLPIQAHDVKCMTVKSILCYSNLCGADLVLASFFKCLPSDTLWQAGSTWPSPG